MKKIVLMLFVASTLLFSSSAFAVGLGVFLDYSNGSGDYEYESSSELDMDADMFAGGFVLDTAPTNESTFNYRLNIGFADQTVETDLDYDEDMEANGVYLENIFGFAIIKKENFRWWIGPLLRIGYYSGDTEIEEWDGTTYDIDYEYVELGAGVVTGLNFKAGSVIIAPSIGVRFSAFAGEADIDGYGDEDIDATTTMAFANIALLF